MEAMEFYGRVNLLKGAIVAANAVTTVSPRYAQEIQTYESTRELFGVIYTSYESHFGMHGVILSS